MIPKSAMAAVKYFSASCWERYIAASYGFACMWPKFGGKPLVSTAAIHLR